MANQCPSRCTLPGRPADAPEPETRSRIRSPCERITGPVQRTRDPLGRREGLRDLAPGRARAGPLAHALRGEDPHRERAAERRRRVRERGRRAGAGRVVAQLGPGPRGAAAAGARGDAGLHRRAVRGGPGRHARRHARPGRRPLAHQPAGARRPGDRPLGAGGLLRHRPRVRGQRRQGVRAQRRALRAAALGAAGVPGLPGRAARHRHRAPGEPGVPGQRRGHPRGGRRGPRLPRLAGGHRLPHHDDQRHRHPGLRRGRH